MRHWLAHAYSEPRPGLLENVPSKPRVACFGLLKVLDSSADDPEVQDARRALLSSGPVAAIPDVQHPDGHWLHPGWAYSLRP
jgi:hypothetical protein